MLTLDPATLLPTGEFVEHGLPATVMPRMAQIEAAGSDVNAFATLAGAADRVASLSAATGGDLDRSLRHRELRRPHGLGDELRAACVDATGAWGAVTLLRDADRAAFTSADAAALASVSPTLAEGLRQGALRDLRTAPDAPVDDPPGAILLDGEQRIALVDPAARRWLAELRADDAPPAVVHAVATRARHRAPAQAVARTRTPSGRWLLLRASVLGEAREARTVVTIEAARSAALAPLVAAAYGLTVRERDVSELVAEGLPTAAIARRLLLSPYTVQDHLKAIFAKVGIASRGELVARLFFARDVPTLRQQEAVPTALPASRDD